MNRSFLQTSVVPALQALREWAVQHLFNTRAMLFVLLVVPLCLALLYTLGAPMWLWLSFYAVFLGLLRLLHRPIHDYWGRYMPGGGEAERDRQAGRLNPWQLSSLMVPIFVLVILLAQGAPFITALFVAAWFVFLCVRAAAQARAVYAANVPPTVDSTIDPGSGAELPGSVEVEQP